jgi:outer membrane protein OmpA-like peptidoglycan-associated protein
MKINHSKPMIAGLLLVFCLTSFSAFAGKPNRHPGKRAARHVTKTTFSLSAKKENNVLFGFNKAEIPSKYYNELDNAAKLMKDNKASISLGGYADKTGGYVYNWKLSKKRSDAVKSYLVSKGCDSAKIASTEYGFTHPIASNKTPVGRKKNRRVEIHYVQ